MKINMCNTAIIFYSAQQEQREDMVWFTDIGSSTSGGGANVSEKNKRKK